MKLTAMRDQLRGRTIERVTFEDSYGDVTDVTLELDDGAVITFALNGPSDACSLRVEVDGEDVRP